MPTRQESKAFSHGTGTKISSKILRFNRSERHLHWALAIPFIVCFLSAMALVFIYNPSPTKPYRALFSYVHRTSGILMIFLPFFTAAIRKRDFQVFYYNIKQAWVWTLDDIKWLLLMGLAAINGKIGLPEQGKFNAAEKINFMYLMVTYPLYITTGLIVWFTDNAFAPWILHCLMAVMSAPLIFGHFFMAAINPTSRIGLSGMINGFVDRHWARHHYTKWYREHFECTLSPAPNDEVA